MGMCPENGGQACSAHPSLFKIPRQQKPVHTWNCSAFCASYNRTCVNATMSPRVHGGSCSVLRPWRCDAAPDTMYGELKCTCLDVTRQLDHTVRAHPVSPPSKALNERDQKYVRVALHLDLAPHGEVFIRKREQFIDRDDAHKDFNDMGGYELCHGKELSPPTSMTHCSTGNRMRSDRPCMTRLEQLTYDEASNACRERGGRLAKIQNITEVAELSEFAGRRNLGIGLRDFGADDDWRFDDGSNATDAVDSFQSAFAPTHRRRRRAGNEFRRHGCIMVGNNNLHPLDCAAKSDWVCEGTLANPPNMGEHAMVQGDLMADEGAFCLFHAHETADLLPNDESNGFRNTDLQCHLQVSSRHHRECAFDPTSRRRGLIRKRGDRLNGLNYPVQGWTVGLNASKANMSFLDLENADDDFHCHYTPNNNGLLRGYAMQHMFERSYSGAMKYTCGCGYKHLANLVSRCDCTRSGRADNNCAKWHGSQLIEATKETHAVRCNNCNAKDNL